MGLIIVVILGIIFLAAILGSSGGVGGFIFMLIALSVGFVIMCVDANNKSRDESIRKYGVDVRKDSKYWTKEEREAYEKIQRERRQ